MLASEETSEARRGEAGGGRARGVGPMGVRVRVGDNGGGPWIFGDVRGTYVRGLGADGRGRGEGRVDWSGVVGRGESANQ